MQGFTGCSCGAFMMEMPRHAAGTAIGQGVLRLRSARLSLLRMTIVNKLTVVKKMMVVNRMAIV